MEETEAGGANPGEPVFQQGAGPSNRPVFPQQPNISSPLVSAADPAFPQGGAGRPPIAPRRTFSFQPQQPFLQPQQPLLPPSQPQQAFWPPQQPFWPPQPQAQQPLQTLFPPQQPSLPPAQLQQPFWLPQPQQPFGQPQQSFPLSELLNLPELPQLSEQSILSEQSQQPFPLFPPPSPPRPPLSSGTVTNKYYKYLPLSRAINKGDVQAVKAFLDENPDAISARIHSNKRTALHLACHAGQVEIVKELLSRMSAEDVMVTRRERHTPLTAAAINGNLAVAKALVEKNPRLVETPGKHNDIPVVVAARATQKSMARYLYPKTPTTLFLNDNGYHGTSLLADAIFVNLLDIAVHLTEACPRLGITMNYKIGLSPVCVLASRANLFPSGSKLGFFKRFIYSCIDVKLPSRSGDFQTLDQPKDHSSLLESFRQHLSKFLGIQQLHDLKKTHLQAQKLLQRFCDEASLMSDDDLESSGVVEAMCLAIKNGVVEVVVELIRTDPTFFTTRDVPMKKRLFHMAIENRQEKIFSLFYGCNDNRARLIALSDALGNGILHYAGFAAPPGRLDNISGPALHLQRELQWFKEVERIVPDVDAEKLNHRSLRPREEFTASHSELQKEAEKWMKENATSCSVVAALIVTVTFAAAFTVPGGTEQTTGVPLHLRDKRFTLFMVSDMLSFFSSCTSVLIFLGILTARYSEDDFLVSLPTKMIAGLSILFVSIAAMLLAFSFALLTLLRDMSWMVIPAFLLACLPVLLFVLLQYPILVEMIISTYGKGIFDRDMKPWV